MIMFKNIRCGLASLTLISGLVLSANASAQFFYASDAGCASPITSVAYSGTAAVTVNVCGRVPAAQFFCGHTIQLLAAAGQGGNFSVTGRTPADPFVSAPYTDSNTTLPQVIGNPTATADLGATPSGASGYAAGATRLLSTLQITPAASATSPSYVISFDPNSLLIVDGAATCATAAGDTAAFPTLTLNNTVVVATPTVSVAASPATLVDSASNVATVTFTSSAPAPAGNLSVTFTPPVAGGLIASTNRTSPITITAGSTTATCTVTAAVNAVPGDGPTVGTITVGAGAGYTVGAPASATVTVNNDDVAPGVPAVSVAVAPAALVDAAGNVATVTFTSSLPAPAGGLSVAITPATVGGLIAGTTCASPVTIAAGATTATCTITAVDNTTPGDGPTAGVTTVLAGAGYSVGAPASATVNVTNNDAVPVVPAVFVTAAPNVVGDSGGVITLTFTATSVPAAPLTVNITPPTVGGLIASTTCGATVTITPPATTATCTVTAAANTVPGEAPTASTATVLAGTGYTVGDLPTANISVTDDDAAPVGAATPVPTMGVFGLGLMGLLIAGFAGFAQRRRSNTNA
jgi:hypothetical protein